MSEELLRMMLGFDEPNPYDDIEVYLDRQRMTAGFILTRWWVPGKAVPLLYAIADRKATNEQDVPAEALLALASNVHGWLVAARADYGWEWKGEESDPLFLFLIEFAMSFWPEDDCSLDWVTEQTLLDAQANHESIFDKWRLAAEASRG